MRNVIAPGAVSSAANPILDFWAQASVVDGEHIYYAPALPFALAFQVWDVRNEDLPVQIFPTASGTRQSVDLVNDLVGGVVGRYAANWTCTVAPTAKGRYQIRWFYTPTSTSSELAAFYDFDVLPAAAAMVTAGLGYILPSDMRCEGVTASMSTDANLLRRIDYCSRYVERQTGRFFAPEYKTVQVRAEDGDVLFGESIIALGAVTASNGDVLDPSSFRVSNRHLSSNLTDPDDRDVPVLSLWSSCADRGGYGFPGSFPVQIYGYNAVGGPWNFDGGGYGHRFTVAGLFGYTEYDGTPTGRTPLLIQQAMKLLVMRELDKIGSGDRESAQNRWRIISEQVRDQQYALSPAVDGGITGDRIIDDLLAVFMRPMRIASA